MAGFALDPRAVEDLDRIWNYIAENTSLGAADRVGARFFETFRRLAATPRMGHARPDYTTAPLLRHGGLKGRHRYQPGA